MLKEIFSLGGLVAFILGVLFGSQVKALFGKVKAAA